MAFVQFAKKSGRFYQAFPICNLGEFNLALVENVAVVSESLRSILSGSVRSLNKILKRYCRYTCMQINY